MTNDDDFLNLDGDGKFTDVDMALLFCKWHCWKLHHDYDISDHNHDIATDLM